MSDASPFEAERSRVLGFLVVCLGLALIQGSFGLCTQDDAFISFRYAQNLVEGNGLVYNIGERVEGYTNFLWTLLFAPFIGMGFDPAPISTLLGMALSLGLLALTFEMGGRKLLAPLLVATFTGLSLEAVQGLETVFYAVLVTLALRGGRGWALFAALSALTRPEGVAVFGLLWLFRRRWQDVAVFAGVVGPHIAFRWFYYGDTVPNTFHAKVGGLAIGRGLAYVGGVAMDALPLSLGLIGALVLWAVRERRPGQPGPLVLNAAALVLFMTAYVVAVGGDFKGTARFLIPIVPAAALLVQSIGGWRLHGAIGVAAVVLSVPGFLEMKHFADRFAAELVVRRDIGVFLDETLQPDDVLAVHAAGVLPYYARRQTIDMWGLTDAHIARAPIDTMGEGTAGHERHDYPYVLSRQPDYILPERDLFTPAPVALPNPPEFPPAFAELYAPVSAPVGEGYVNLWRLRPAASPAP